MMVERAIQFTGCRLHGAAAAASAAAAEVTKSHSSTTPSSYCKTAQRCAAVQVAVSAKHAIIS